MNPDLETLSGQFWDARLAADPLGASLLGDHRFDTDLPDLSADGQAALAGRLRTLFARTDALDDAALPVADRINLAILRFELRSDIEALDSAEAEYTVAPTFRSPHAELLETVPNLTLTSPADAEALLARYGKVTGYLAQSEQRLLDGVAAGRTPPAQAVTATIRQLDEYLASPVADDPLLTPAPPASWDEATASAWRNRLQERLTDTVRPALQRYRHRLHSDILPAARAPEHSGVTWLPDGSQIYARAIRQYTCLDLPPEQLHQMGADAVAALADEYRELGSQVLGTSDLGAIFDRLRNDLELRFQTSEEVRATAEQALRRAQDQVPSWFGRLPRADCQVREMAAHEVKDGTIAYYFAPADDGSRPGTYYINTWAPQTRPRFEAEALAFHESVPGHHLQLAIAQELDDVPDFRRHAAINAYIEGWALYAERLADEMGLYSSDTDRLGVLSFDSWRACRLVVDTGLHHFGWSRQQAIAYMTDNSPLALNNIANEVDRYISWPGQALGYKVGQLEIRRLRQQAERSLGSDFSLPAFHDEVLRHGAVPLGVLGELVDRWTADLLA